MPQVRLQLQEKLDVDLADRKKEVKTSAALTMHYILSIPPAGRHGCLAPSPQAPLYPRYPSFLIFLNFKLLSPINYSKNTLLYRNILSTKIISEYVFGLVLYFALQFVTTLSIFHGFTVVTCSHVLTSFL